MSPGAKKRREEVVRAIDEATAAAVIEDANITDEQPSEQSLGVDIIKAKSVGQQAKETQTEVVVSTAQSVQVQTVGPQTAQVGVQAVAMCQEVQTQTEADGDDPLGFACQYMVNPGGLPKLWKKLESHFGVKLRSVQVSVNHTAQAITHPCSIINASIMIVPLFYYVVA